MPRSHVPSRNAAQGRSWRSHIRTLAAVVGIAALPAACSGGGCSGCSGVTPLPGGFTQQKRIENSASVRLTKPGLDFLSANIGSVATHILGGGQGTLEFPINESNGTINTPWPLPNINYTICPGGPTDTPKKCKVEIDLAGSDFQIASAAPHDLNIVGHLHVRLQDLPVHALGSTVDVTLSGDQSCPGGNSTFGVLNATVSLSIETDGDMTHARYGDSMIKINSIDVDKTSIKNALNFCNGGILGAGLDLFKGTVVNLAYNGIIGNLKNTVENQFCQKSNPMVNPTCPTGSNDVSGICRYGTDGNAPCVSQILGTEGHANLGGLLAKLSPGTKGGMDFLLAVGGADKRDDNSGYTWGDLNPINGGATLGMYGGVEPNPLSGCVPISNLQLPTGIPIPNELTDDALITNWPAGTPGPHLGLAISERYMNYALSGMYNSGLLCIGVSTATNDLINSGTFSLLISSLKNLGLQQEPQPVGIVIRPTTPPVVTFGNGTNIDTDPNVLLQLKQASFDFYVFSSDRYIRFMTATFDITAPINLTVGPAGLTPVLKTLKVENGVVTNSSLLKEDPTTLAAALQAIIGSQVGSLLGKGLPAVDINTPLAKFGLKLDLPPTVDGQGSPGLRKLTKGTDNYLGIFGGFQTAMFQEYSIDTSVKVVGKDIKIEGLRGETMTADNGPVVTVLADSPADDGTHPIEYGVRVDYGVWKPWTTERYIQVSDDSLRIEGHHVIEVRARVKDEPYTVSETPAATPVIIDTMPPAIGETRVNDAGIAKLDVFDLVSRDATMVRYKLDGGAFTDWQPVTELRAIDVGKEAAEITIEARDEEGNVGKAQQPLIRGADRSAASGCGCSVPRGTEPKPFELLLLGASIAGMASRLRRRLRGKSTKGTPVAATSDVEAPAAALVAARRRNLTVGVGLATLVGGAFSGCHCGDQVSDGSYKCDPATCTTLSPGLIGSYTSAAVGPGDKLWVAGYLEGDYDNNFPYGDLVVGTYNANAQKVDWKIIDGVPTDPKVDSKQYNIRGFRGGQTAPGDDVGLWTSIAVGQTGSPGVSYYDRTQKELRYAELNGTVWDISRVDQADGADIGRYSKLHFEGAVPVIAYLAMYPTQAGFITSKVRVARGDGNGGWAYEDVVTNDQTPCRADLCTGGSFCVKSTGKCEAPGTGCQMCATSDQCVTDGTTSSCQTVFAATHLEPYPDATGLYIASAPTSDGSFGLAFYDRVKGTENIATRDPSGTWSTKVIDGGDPKNPTDVGIGTSLFIDQGGDWHLTYVDGYAETLKYARVSGGAVKDIEVVDDGLKVGGTAFPDGQHLVGDDSFITVAGDGTVHVSYQDATAGTLHFAEGNPNSTGHDWKVHVVDQPGQFAGFFSSQVQLGGQLTLVNWWRVGGNMTQGDVSIMKP